MWIFINRVLFENVSLKHFFKIIPISTTKFLCLFKEVSIFKLIEKKD